MWTDKEQIPDDVIFNELSSSLTRERIMWKAERNNENPYGYVCDLVLDNYPVTLHQNDRITNRILKHFGI